MSSVMESKVRIQREDFSGALHNYQRAYRYDDTAIGALSEIVALAFQLKRSAEAARYAVIAAERHPQDPALLRQLAMYLSRRYTEASLADIGRALNRDHPAVSNAIRKIERQLLENVRLRYQVEAIIGRLAELGYQPLHGRS